MKSHIHGHEHDHGHSHEYEFEHTPDEVRHIPIRRNICEIMLGKRAKQSKVADIIARNKRAMADAVSCFCTHMAATISCARSLNDKVGEYKQSVGSYEKMVTDAKDELEKTNESQRESNEQMKEALAQMGR